MKSTDLGVPETIERSTFVIFLENLGIDPNRCQHVGMNSRGVYAKMYAHDEAGKKIILHTGAPAMNTVFVRFT